MTSLVDFFIDCDTENKVHGSFSRFFKEALKGDRSGRIECAVLVIAAWCLYRDKGVNRHNRKLDIVDEKKS
jgi:hypothetical protein